jgi:hypothetical protein
MWKLRSKYDAKYSKQKAYSKILILKGLSGRGGNLLSQLLSLLYKNGHTLYANYFQLFLRMEVVSFVAVTGFRRLNLPFQGLDKISANPSG